jgi:uncharacterized phage protein (TIGR01671 family)
MYKVYSKSRKKELEARDYALTASGEVLEYICHDDVGWVELPSPEKQDTVFCLKVGFKDKNGTDIYEGDIVKWIVRPLWMRYADEFVEWERSGKPMQDFIRVVEWKYNCFDCFSRNAFVPYDSESCEIIGNKFENPELLQKR